MKHFRKLSVPYFIWCIIFILIPLVLIILYAFTNGGNDVKTLNFTLDNFARIFDETYIKVFAKSLLLGVLTTAICFVMGYPLAYIISKQDDSIQDMLIMAVTIPTWINMVIRTYAWINLLSDNGIINGLLGLLGIDPVTMMYTNFSVVLGLVCNLVPFMIIPIHTSLRKMDPSLTEAAMDLGADPVQTFIRVIFKLSMPGVINGIIMVFLMAISSFVIPRLLGGGQFVLIGNLIEQQFVSVGDWNFGSAISTILAVLILIAMRLMKKMDASPMDEA
ncbi:MAG: ABC transporter permease [Lachnospiraceae bacterium]|nr:ABC transporter permease [Lachnospiraceae bacterium]